MKNKFHGVFSLFLIILSIIVGLLSVLNESFVMGLWYIAIIFLSPPIILYSFCAKCICRLDSCRHIFPGRLSQLLPPRQQGHYTFWDIFWTSVALLALLLFPQYWLWKNITFFIIFWISCFIALTEILLFVCRGCKNKRCPIYVWNGKELF